LPTLPKRAFCVEDVNSRKPAGSDAFLAIQVTKVMKRSGFPRLST
jgi:hypothetical protein